MRIEQRAQRTERTECVPSVECSEPMGKEERPKIIATNGDKTRADKK